MKWIEWLAERLPNQEDRDQLQLFMGASMVDRQVSKAEKMLLLCGKEANGKSTFRRTIERLCAKEGSGISIVPFVQCFKDTNNEQYWVGAMDKHNLCSAILEWSDVKRYQAGLKSFISNESKTARSAYGQPFRTTSLPFLIAESNTEWNMDTTRRIIRLEMTPITEPYDVRFEEQFNLDEVARWVAEGKEKFMANNYKFN